MSTLASFEVTGSDIADSVPTWPLGGTPTWRYRWRTIGGKITLTFTNRTTEAQKTVTFTFYQRVRNKEYAGSTIVQSQARQLVIASTLTGVSGTTINPYAGTIKVTLSSTGLLDVGDGAWTAQIPSAVWAAHYTTAGDCQPWYSHRNYSGYGTGGEYAQNDGVTLAVDMAGTVVLQPATTSTIYLNINAEPDVEAATSTPYGDVYWWSQKVGAVWTGDSGQTGGEPTTFYYWPWISFLTAPSMGYPLFSTYQSAWRWSRPLPETVHEGINTIRIPNGPEIISRADDVGGAITYRRDRPADAWSLKSTDDLGSGHNFPAPHASGPWPSVVNMQQLPLVSDDLGRTYGAPPAWQQTDRPDIYSTPRNALSWDCYAVAQMADQRLAGFLYYDRADALYWMPGDTTGRAAPYYATITSAARPGSAVLWPWMYVLPHGVWCVGAMRDDTYREWRSDNLSGTSWTKEIDVALSGADLSVAAMWRSVNGRQVVVGHDGTAYVCFTRLGQDETWTGPVTVETNDTATAPYILQRRDGTWECGWLIGDTWTRYTADEPSSWEICS